MYNVRFTILVQCKLRIFLIKLDFWLKIFTFLDTQPYERFLHICYFKWSHADAIAVFVSTFMVYFYVVWEIRNITNFLFGLQSMKLSKKIIETFFISLLSIGLLVQSSLSKCSGYDLLKVFSSSGYGSLICVFISMISLLFDNKSILNTSATGFSMVCISSA